MPRVLSRPRRRRFPTRLRHASSDSHHLPVPPPPPRPSLLPRSAPPSPLLLPRGRPRPRCRPAQASGRLLSSRLLAKLRVPLTHAFLVRLRSICFRYFPPPSFFTSPPPFYVLVQSRCTFSYPVAVLACFDTSAASTALSPFTPNPAPALAATTPNASPFPSLSPLPGTRPLGAPDPGTSHPALCTFTSSFPLSSHLRRPRAHRNFIFRIISLTVNVLIVDPPPSYCLSYRFLFASILEGLERTTDSHRSPGT